MSYIFIYPFLVQMETVDEERMTLLALIISVLTIIILTSTLVGH